jgi:ABC-type transporter Mla subunit MlaD
MPIRRFIIAAFTLALSACTDGPLDLNLRLDRPPGLAPGAPVLLGNQTAGQVAAVQPDASGGYVAQLEIAPEFRKQATQDARFVVVRDADGSGRRHVEIEPGKPGSPLLADHAQVRGSIEPEPLFPLGEILRGFTDALGQLRGEVERFRGEMQRLPQSEDAQRLKEEWAKLMEEMKQAQETAEESVKKDLLPKLQRELDELDRKLKKLNSAPPAKPSAI